MESATKRPPGCLRSQIGCQWGQSFGIVTRVICKLDRDRFSGALWDGAVQLLNGSFGFDPLIEPDETNTFGEPLKRKTKRNSTQMKLKKTRVNGLRTITQITLIAK